MTKPQVIEQDGKPAFVVVPFDDWKKIEALIEDAGDNAALEHFRSNRPETFPAGVVDAILDGQHPVKAYRIHRNLNQAELAQKAGIATPYLSQIENRLREPSMDVAKRLASALGVAVDDIV